MKSERSFPLDKERNISLVSGIFVGSILGAIIAKAIVSLFM
jgi:hypothetical protein